ncbi:hypothetical protein HGRIS_008671 [Hohenbuehelia grisea]|uniref:F-box domain-containing protein n=1 Tax=Hohenbuehelia grisea TaxID=104357 RepID=A0ABR3J8Q7_9AGAR
MTAEHTLPTELIVQVLSYLAKPQLAVCRLTCKAFDAEIRPRFYRTISWDIAITRGGDPLADRTYAAGAHAQELTVSIRFSGYTVGPTVQRLLRETPIVSPADDPIARLDATYSDETARAMIPDTLQGVLLNAISLSHFLRTFPENLPNLQSCRSDYINSLGPYGPLLLEGLAKLPLFKSLSIYSDSPLKYPLPLHLFSTLESITLYGMSGPFLNFLLRNVPILLERNPNLTSMSIGHPNGDAHLGEMVELLEMLVPTYASTIRKPLKELKILGFGVTVQPQSIAQFRHLTSLELRSYPNPRIRSSHDTLLAGLEAENIHLRHLTIDSVSTALISYLTSYRGLTSLTILGALASGHLVNTNLLADQFHSQVLPRHALTLTQLSIKAKLGTRWCFGEHNADAFAQCVTLQDLKVTLLFPDNFSEKGEFIVSTYYVLNIKSQWSPHRSVPNLDLRTSIRGSLAESTQTRSTFSWRWKGATDSDKQ